RLILTTASDYAGGTTIADGVLEARDGALGTGPVTMAGGNLNLRTDAATSRFGNDLSASDGTIDIRRITAGTTGTIQLGKLSIGASRLRFTGASGGTVEFTGAATLSGASVFENYVSVLFSSSIGGSGSFTKDTGAGTLTFGGTVANSYSGDTRVNAG